MESGAHPGKDGAEMAAGAGENFGIDELVSEDTSGERPKAGGFFAATPGGGLAGGLHGDIEYLRWRRWLVPDPSVGVALLEEKWTGGEGR